MTPCFSFFWFSVILVFWIIPLRRSSTYSARYQDSYWCVRHGLKGKLNIRIEYPNKSILDPWLSRSFRIVGCLVYQVTNQALSLIFFSLPIYLKHRYPVGDFNLTWPKFGYPLFDPRTRNPYRWEGNTDYWISLIVLDCDLHCTRWDLPVGRHWAVSFAWVFQIAILRTSLW